MLKKYFFMFIVLNFIFAEECDDMKTLFESDNINAAYSLIMTDFMTKGVAEYGNALCNFTAYKVAIKLDDLELAKKYIESAIKSDDKEEFRSEADKLTNTIREYKSAKYTLENGLIDDAIKEYEEKINSTELLPIALFYKGLGTAYKKKHFTSDLSIDDSEYFTNLSSAVEYFSESIKINPYKDYDNEILNISKYLTKSGKEKQKEEDYESALTLFNKAIEFYPDYNLAYFYKGQLYMRIQDYELALESFKAGLGEDIKKGNYKILYLAGSSLEKLGDLDRALKFYDYSINNKSSYTKAYFGKANVLYKQQNFSASESVLLDIIQNEPDYIKAYELLVNLYLDLEDNSNAKKYAEIGVEFDPKSYSLLAQLAFLSNENKNYEDAISYSNKSMKYKRDYGPALIELGRAYTFTCKGVAAKDAFKRAKRFDRRMASDLEKWSKDHIDTACK